MHEFLLSPNEFFHVTPPTAKRPGSREKGGNSCMIKNERSGGNPIIRSGIRPIALLLFLPPGGQAKSQIRPKLGVIDHLTWGYICTKFQANSTCSYETCHLKAKF